MYLVKNNKRLCKPTTGSRDRIVSASRKPPTCLSPIQQLPLPPPPPTLLTLCPWKSSGHDHWGPLCCWILWLFPSTPAPLWQYLPWNVFSPSCCTVSSCLWWFHNLLVFLLPLWCFFLVAFVAPAPPTCVSLSENPGWLLWWVENSLESPRKATCRVLRPWPWLIVWGFLIPLMTQNMCVCVFFFLLTSNSCSFSALSSSPRPTGYPTINFSSDTDSESGWTPQVKVSVPWDCPHSGTSHRWGPRCLALLPATANLGAQ